MWGVFSMHEGGLMHVFPNPVNYNTVYNTIVTIIQLYICKLQYKYNKGLNQTPLSLPRVFIMKHYYCFLCGKKINASFNNKFSTDYQYLLEHFYYCQDSLFQVFQVQKFLQQPIAEGRWSGLPKDKCVAEKGFEIKISCIMTQLLHCCCL